MLNLSVEDPAVLARICHALSSPLRVEIVRLLNRGALSCQDIGKALDCPLSTISINVQTLEDAGLVLCERLPAKNGTRKICSLVYSDAQIQLASQPLPENTGRYEVEMPVGNYMGFEVRPSCGFVCADGTMPDSDQPTAFLDKKRLEAQLVWFRQGYLEYLFPAGRGGRAPRSLSFSMELCSEAPGFNTKWKSDISLWVNGVKVGTWTCPGDFGERRGRLTPEFWSNGNTQYGLLTEWRLNAEGCSVNGELVSAVTVRDVGLGGGPFIAMRIGVEQDAAYMGGVNIFGEAFGDYPQNIRMTVTV